MEKSRRPRKVLNPKLRVPFYATIFIGVIVVILLLTHNGLVTGAISGAIAGGLGVLISFGVVAIIAQISGMYVLCYGRRFYWHWPIE